MPPFRIGYTPTPAQEPFHRSGAFERLLVGGFGSGKTYALCAEAIAYMLEQPGIRGMIARATVPALKASTESVFVDLLPPELWNQCKVTRSGGHLDTIRFPNGSEVLFKSMDDWRKHRSINLGFLCFDEADEIDQETYEGMLSRLRQKEPTAAGLRHGAKRITRRGVWAAMNPAGHSWHWERFVRDGSERREWFRATSLDNPYLPPEYVDMLLSYPVPWLRRFVLAAWDEFGGAIYESWSDEHIVPRYPVDPVTGRIKYPEGSVFWMGMDPGTRDPTAGLWVVVEKQPRLRFVAVAEYQEHSLAASVHAQAWRRLEAQHQLRVNRRIADPNSVGVRDRGTNNRLDDIYRRQGFNFELGPSRYDDRIPALAQLIENKQFVVTQDCMQTFGVIRDARWRDLTPAQRAKGEDAPEKPLKANRHLCDCAEYLAGRWTKPILKRPQLPEDRPAWMWEAQATIRRKLGQEAKRPLSSRGRPSAITV